MKDMVKTTAILTSQFLALEALSTVEALPLEI